MRCNCFGNRCVLGCDELKNVSFTKELSSKYGNFSYFPSTVTPKVLDSNPFTVSGKTATVKAKKGTYRIKVQIMSTGNAEFEASGWKTITITVKVK